MYDSALDAVVVSGEILREYINKTEYLYEFVQVACYIQDELEKFGEEAFASVFSHTPRSLIFGKGRITIPQEIIDLFDSAIQLYCEIHGYPVAIKRNGTIEERTLDGGWNCLLKACSERASTHV